MLIFDFGKQPDLTSQQKIIPPMTRQTQKGNTKGKIMAKQFIATAVLHQTFT